MPAPTPQIETVVGSQRLVIDLTRRRFLCMLFSFLSAVSILIAISAVLIETLAPSIKTILIENDLIGLKDTVKIIFLAAYVIVFWQMIVATFLGLYYLGDRLNRPDPQAN